MPSNTLIQPYHEEYHYASHGILGNNNWVVCETAEWACETAEWVADNYFSILTFQGTSFQRIIRDSTCPEGEGVKKIIFCSGKIYYELANKRTELEKNHNVAIIRVEQVCILYVCVYVCVCMYICMYACICMYVCLFVCLFAYMFVYVYVCLHTCL